MSFLGNAVKLINFRNGIRGWKSPVAGGSDVDVSSTQNMDFDFSIRDYAKESFLVLIKKPLSRYMLKFMRIASLTISGILCGVVVAVVCVAIFLQFGSIGSTLLSSLVVNELESLLPDMDISVKSTMLRKNLDTGSIEIAIKKLKLDDMAIHKLSILPDYLASLKQQRLVMRTVYLEAPKIEVNFFSNLKLTSFNPNFEKRGSNKENKELFEPASVIDSLRRLMNGVTVKLINADVSIGINDTNWQLKNLYCEHKMGDKFPSMIDCSLVMPEQLYTTNVGIIRNGFGKKCTYDVKLGAINPTIMYNKLIGSDLVLDRKLLAMIDGYNLPVSGHIKLNFNEDDLVDGDFDLVGSTGAIKLPVKNTLSLNLGKRIDSGSISGSFSPSRAKINSLNIMYGNSGVQFTGIDVPLNEYKFLDVANIDGTLSLTNIDVHEIDSLLPDNISRSAIPIFKNYLPGFKLELFKIDLRGPIGFGDRENNGVIMVDHGVFRIKNAKVSFGDSIISNIDASGSISDDGFDIKLTGANFKNAKVNNGIFFLSKKDNSLIGRVNVDIKIDEISSYLRNISPKLASLPLEKLNIGGVANMNLKLVRSQVDPEIKKNLPFRVVEGSGIVKSSDNSKELKISWDKNGLSASGDVRSGESNISLRVEEDFANNSGVGSYSFTSNSAFLKALAPNFRGICDGNFTLKINSSWEGAKEEGDISLDLKNATMLLPMVGHMKQRADDGVFTAHLVKDNGKLEFSNMCLRTKESRINGNMLMDDAGNILRCAFDKFDVNDCSAKINILRDDDGKVLFSAVGDGLNASKAISALDQLDKNTLISAYIDLKEMVISRIHRVKNVKGNFDIKKGRITGGSCYAVINQDTTVALTSKDIDGGNDSMISLSFSNAGELLKYLKITDTVKGGSINVVLKISKNADQSLSGAFEMNDFIVKNNAHLMKLVYLSSNSWLPNSDNVALCFNLCDGNFTIADNQINATGRAISPNIGIFFNGSYDRLSDNFDVSGVSLPMSSVLNNYGNSGESLAANYTFTGPLENPIVSVKPMRLMSNYDLNEMFGHVLPVAISSDHTGCAPTGESLSDPFSKNAFDVNVSETPKANAHRNLEHSTDKKFGVKITRGSKKT
ncbi:MAG: hypothetical protein LBB63_00725 [Holosporaceae bacterium]|jgi:hypothetical protein|nr:hypothetical protein [Holosporaceae bacterium]